MLRRASVFVTAPRATWKWNEQFGLAYLEAMATGLPVVTTVCGTNHEAVREPNIRTANSAEALADGLVAFLANGGHRNEVGAANRALVLARHDRRTQAARVADAFAALEPSPVTTSCAVCGAVTEPWPLDRRNSVDRCETMRPVSGTLRDAPAGGPRTGVRGDPSLDWVRLTLTYRRLRRLVPGRGARVFEGRLRHRRPAAAVLGRRRDGGRRRPGTARGRPGPCRGRGGDLTAAPLADRPDSECHDLVVGVHVIEHVADLAGFADACRDLLRPGGRLVLLTPAGDGIGLARFRSRWWMLEDPTHVRFLTRRLGRPAARDCRTCRRPGPAAVLDSVGVEAASLVRAVRWRHLPAAGVLSWPVTRALVLVTAPVVLAVRLLVPSTRPTLEVVARCPDPQP